MSLAVPSEDTARLRLQKVLQQTPLFADLDPEALKVVEHELTLMVLPGGAPLFRAGEPADAVYVVTSGCLGVFRHEAESDAHEPVLIAEVPPGNLVGEMSLLSRGKRTRSVAALRDSEVWRLAQTSFNALTSHHPEVLPALMRSVVARNALDTGKRRRQPRTFAILPSGPDVPSARFAVMLADALGRIGNQVQMLGPESADRGTGVVLRCEMESSFVLYRADPTLTPWTELCLRQADCLVAIRNADNDLPTKLPFEVETAQSGAVFHRRRELVQLHEGHDPKAGSTAALLAGRPGRHTTIMSGSTSDSDIDRLARLLTGHAAGVVMAGGGARAFSSIRRDQGTARKRRADRPGQGGTSMGAIVAAGVASRWSNEELDTRCRAGLRRQQSAQRLHAAADFAVRRTEAARGSLRAAFGEKDIEDLILPAIRN